MLEILRRTAVVLAAGACTVAVSVPSAHAAAAAATARECSSLPVIYLVHGIGQGPTAAHPQLSQSPTLQSFVNDMDEDTNSPEFHWDAIIYPAASPANLAATWDTYMNDGERNLQSEIAAENAGTCPADRHIALVGYSMGAWVVDKWLKDHPGEWGEVRAVTLFGDPCWTSPKYNEGLTRLYLASYGCPAPGNYPYPAGRASVPFPVSSYSLNKDPVSGQGFSASFTAFNQYNQDASALACVSARTCPHLDYQNGQAGAGLVEDGAKLVAQHFAGLA